MGGFKVNFAEVESSFQPIPEGRYDAVVETVEVRESNSSDNDYLNWEFKILDEEYEDRRLWMITSLSPKALFRVKDTFLALGVIEEDDEIDIEWEDDVDITPREGPRMIAPEVDGLPCVVVVTNEVYDGRERNRVNEIAPADSEPDARPAKGSNGAEADDKARSGQKTKAGAGKARSRKLR
jgi:hypothetical protein